MSRSVVEIDTGAIAHNVAVLRGAIPEGTQLCAVVKADGYGHGAATVARAALDAGAGWLAVAHAAEGSALRRAGIDAPILLLSEPVDHDEVRVVVADELRATVYSADAVAALAATGARVAVHLKVDTGMRRVGAHPEELAGVVGALAAAPTLELEGICTHCAVADEPDNPFTARQLERFAAAVDALARAGVRAPLRHTANSATVLTRPDAAYELVRPGIALYGVPPSPALAGAVPLRPALRWRSAVSHVKRLRAGEGISYGHHHRAPADTVVATVPVGYADGLPRRWGLTGGVVLIGGRRRAILGVVTMDQLMVDCGPDGGGVARGDEVVLIGEQGDDRIAAEELAAAVGTIGYEVLTAVGRRSSRTVR